MNGSDTGRSPRLHSRRCVVGKMKWKLDADDGWSTQQSNNKLVWDETLLIMRDLFDNVWGNKQEVEVGHAVDLILPVCLSLFVLSSALIGGQIALNVIGAAGFGRRMSWKEEEIVPYGHTMSFKVRFVSLSPNYGLSRVPSMHSTPSR